MHNINDLHFSVSMLFAPTEALIVSKMLISTPNHSQHLFLNWAFSLLNLYYPGDIIHIIRMFDSSLMMKNAIFLVWNKIVTSAFFETRVAPADSDQKIVYSCPSIASINSH